MIDTSKEERIGRPLRCENPDYLGALVRVRFEHDPDFHFGPPSKHSHAGVEGPD